MVWGRMRWRSASLMIVIALIGGGLGGYRLLSDAVERGKIDQALKVWRFYEPGIDPDRLEPRLSSPSPDGASQDVSFTDKMTGRTTIVTIPLSGRRSPAAAPALPYRTPPAVPGPPSRP